MDAPLRLKGGLSKVALCKPIKGFVPIFPPSPRCTRAIPSLHPQSLAFPRQAQNLATRSLPSNTVSLSSRLAQLSMRPTNLRWMEVELMHHPPNSWRRFVPRMKVWRGKNDRYVQSAMQRKSQTMSDPYSTISSETSLFFDRATVKGIRVCRKAGRSTERTW